MKVLHICSSIGIHSGVAKVIMEYYRALKDEVEFDFLYWVDDDKDYSKEISQYGGAVIRINKPSVFGYNQFVKEIDKLSKDYNIIHNHELYLSRFIYRIANKNNCKVVGHAHNTEYSDKMLARIRNGILCYKLRNTVDLMMACSESAGEHYYKDIFQREGKVLPNAFEVSKYKFDEEARKRIRKELNINSKKVFLHIGRFNKQKNHKFIIDIFYSYHLYDEKSILLLIGEGPEKQVIKKLVMNLGIQNSVFFLGTKSNTYDYMNAADVLLFPSLFEGLGIVVVEAQYSGLYCLISDRVPDEAFITTHIHSLSIDKEKDIEIWKKAMMDEKKINYERTILNLKTDIYDISSSKDRLMKYYLEVIR